MPNPYVPTTWVDGTTAITAARLTNAETGITDATTQAYGAIAKPGTPTTNHILYYNGSIWTNQLLVDANVSASAALAVTKLALGSADTVLQSNGSANSFATTTGANARVAVAKNSAATTGTRRQINFIEGSNVTLTVADNGGSERVDVTIASATPPNSTTIVQQNGSLIGQRQTINFISPTGMSAPVIVDNGGSSRIDFTIYDMPIGAVTIWIGHIATITGLQEPVNGWLLLNGTTFTAATNAPTSTRSLSSLFNVLTNNGTIYSYGGGAGTASLPNFQSNFPIGISGSYGRGAVGGEVNHTLTTAEMPSHDHGGITGDTGFNNSAMNPGGTNVVLGTNTNAELGIHHHTISPAGGGGAHNNLPPYVAVHYLIKL